MKFKRAGRRKSRGDEEGDVLVKCMLYNAKGVVKGNIITTLRVSEAKVSQVNSAIEKFLFGSEEEGKEK